MGLLMLAMALMLMLTSCPDSKDPAPPAIIHSTSSSVALQNSPLAFPFADLPPPAGQASAQQNVVAPNTDIEFEQLRRLPHLSGMSQKDVSTLRHQLQQTSLSQRLNLLKSYPALENLPVQQKQLLLEQMAHAVPDRTPAMRLACTCRSGPKREMCIKEECGATSTLSAMCASICGATNIASTSCMPSAQCTDQQ
jgi:hypothetical protein